MKPQLPQALSLCLATLVAGGAYVLQNAEHYAAKLKDEDFPYADVGAHWLTIAAEYTGFTEFNQAQRSWLDKWIALGGGIEEADTEPEEEDDTDSQPAPQPAPEPAPAPAEQKEEPLPTPEEDTDPQPSTEQPTPQPDIPPLLDTTFYPLDSDSTPPQETEATPQEKPTIIPDTAGQSEPIPTPAPDVNDVSEPSPAPATEPEPTTEQTLDTPIEPEIQVPMPEQQPMATTPAPPVRCKIMMMGDSMMEDLGPRTHRRLRQRKGLNFILSAKYSTGLCRPDFFDWPAHMREAIAEHKPNILVVFIGANDGQPIKHNGTFTPTGGQTWRDCYGTKMQEIVDIAHAHGTKVIWVGLPGIGGRYSKLLAETSVAQQEFCTRTGIPFIDTRPTLSDENGEFQAFRKDKNGKIVRLRRPDKTHLTPEGNNLLIDQLMPELEKHLHAFSAEHPELCLSEEEARNMGPATLSVTVKYVPSSRKRRKKK